MRWKANIEEGKCQKYVRDEKNWQELEGIDPNHYATRILAKIWQQKPLWCNDLNCFLRITKENLKRNQRKTFFKIIIFPMFSVTHMPGQMSKVHGTAAKPYIPSFSITSTLD